MSLKDKLHFLGVLFKDVVRRDWAISFKEYRPFLFKYRKAPRYVFMIDGKRNHGGMFDRLKGLITIYAIAKAQKIDFKVYFIWPFNLEKYLEPNRYDWVIPEDDPIRYNYPATRPVIAYGESPNPYRLMKRRKGECHFYYGFDSLDKVNTKYGTSYDWGILYRELFRPTQYLQKNIDMYQRELGNDYIAVHIRIMNLLGDKVELYGNRMSLPENKQEELRSQLRTAIEKIVEDHPGKRILLATDSNNFVEYVMQIIPELYVIPGTIKHVDTSEDTNEQENIKLFLDYYMISGASQVYSLVGGGLYPSAFPKYSAKIGGVDFKRVTI